MIPSIATVTMGGDLPARFAAAKAAGFRAVELFDTDLDAHGATVADIKLMLRDAGLETASYFPLREVEGAPSGERQAIRDRAAVYFDVAAELGAPMVMMCSATDEGLSGDQGRILDDLSHLADMAGERGLRLAFEALSWGRHVFDYRVAADLVAKLQHPGFGLVLDSFHIFARSHSLDEIAHIPPEHIFLVQVSDAPMLDLAYLDWSRSYRTIPGYGAFDLATFTANVRATGYDGVFSLECFSDELKRKGVKDVASEGFAAIMKLWGDKGVPEP